MEPEVIEVVASAIRFLPQAVLLTEAVAGIEQVIFANIAFEELSGYTEKELRGRDLTLLAGAETEHASLQQLLRSNGNQEERPWKVVLYRKSGTVFQDCITRHKLAAREGNYFVQVHLDITGSSEHEQSLIRSEPGAASDKEIGDIAHDFNNLLTGIMVYAGLLASRIQNDEQLERYAKGIRASAERAAQLVTQLFERYAPHHPGDATT